MVTNETHFLMTCGCEAERLFRHEDIEEAHEWIERHKCLPVDDEDSAEAEHERQLEMADNFPEWYVSGPP